VVEQAFDEQAGWRSATTVTRVVGKLARYRCTACGNLTRFDVVTTRRSRAFHHYTVGGELAIEDEEVLSEVVEEISCRWCGTGGDVEHLEEDVVS
jgi:NAD-dependent SIR2 family protein deacetylase